MIEDPRSKIQDRSFYSRPDTNQVAKDLLGKLLVVPTGDGQRVSGMIVETEAYLGEIDKAAHTYGGRRTERNEITYAVGGHVYVFFVYGMYFQLNVVTGEKDSPHVVLIRAVEPVDGIDVMRDRRSWRRGVRVEKPLADKDLTSGPGKLCIAFGIDRSFNGEDLLGRRIWIEDFRPIQPPAIREGVRIGIDYAGEFVHKPWRYWVEDNQFVSRHPKVRATDTD